VTAENPASISRETVEGALTRLADMVPLVVIKCGSQGSMTQRDSKIIRVPALNVKPVDTTGAGDCFNAGFVYGYLRDETVEQCLRYANITGGLSTTAPGALAVPQVDRVIEIARHYDQYARQPDERRQG
jgi:sugar/nucleoside kinase (ribokinase family)